MPCSSCNRQEGSVCKLRAFVGKFDRIADERTRVQCAVFDLLRRDLGPDGLPEENKIPCSRLEEADAAMFVGRRFAAHWHLGERCPDRIAQIINLEQLAEPLNQ